MRSRGFAQSLRAVLERPGLILTLATFNLAFAWLVTTPLSSALAFVLDRRPASWRLLAGEDGFTGEILSTHPELARLALTTLALGALVYLLLSWALAGGILSAFGLDGPEPARGASPFSAACGRNALRMSQVGAAGLLLRLLPLALGVGLYAALKPLVADRGFHLYLTALLGGALICGFVWAIATVVIDYGFGLALGRPADGAWALLGRALRIAREAPGRTLGLALISSGGWLLLSILEHALKGALPIASAWAFALRTLVGIVIELARATLTAAVLVCAAGTSQAGRD